MTCRRVEGGYRTQVAEHRIAAVVETVGMTEMLLAPGLHGYLLCRQFETLADAPRSKIGLPCDGKTYVDPDLPSFRRRLVALRQLGYRVPDSVFRAVDAELAVLGG